MIFEKLLKIIIENDHLLHFVTELFKYSIFYYVYLRL